LKKKKLYLTLLLIILIAGFYTGASKKANSATGSDLHTIMMPDTAHFSLRKGDILVRPNWGGLPGTWPVHNGRRYGHVAMVTSDASGNTIEEALSKATVIEALFFDQHTRKFQFARKDQIREGYAIISFGRRFKGIRYRLRMDITDDQSEKMIRFLRNQLDGGYNILSAKKKFKTDAERQLALVNMKISTWHCATLIWEAFYLVTGTDLDANGGLIIYPADMIASKYFDSADGRVCF
jgi:hypothetical protein